MEGILKVTPEKLISTSSEFSQKGTAVSNLTTEMTSLVTGLSSVWLGDAASAYTQKFKGLDSDIQKLNKMIQEHSKDLSEMAKVYTQAEKASVDEINTLSSSVII
jgi:WXG100 family type VII secretion target